MSPEAQRIAIAEACGLKLIQAADGWWDVEENGVFREVGMSRESAVARLPDYLHDLNAMHKAEEVLPDEQNEQVLNYLNALLDVLGINLGPGGWDMDTDSVWQMTHATAAQRAEAFLRTIGKWEGHHSQPSYIYK